VLVATVRSLLLGTAEPAAASPASVLESWPTESETVSTSTAPGESAKPPSVDDYFERLDRAFANLNVPLEPREPVCERPHPAPALQPVPEPVHAVGAEPAKAPTARSLADRFETMLAVEQGELPASALEPAMSSADAELVDRVARRVVEQLGDNAVRQLAAEIVSRTAERLVREEIDRIKGGIRS
jgi:hypothetical protein